MDPHDHQPLLGVLDQLQIAEVPYLWLLSLGIELLTVEMKVNPLHLLSLRVVLGQVDVQPYVLALLTWVVPLDSSEGHLAGGLVCLKMQQLSVKSTTPLQVDLAAHPVHLVKIATHAD